MKIYIAAPWSDRSIVPAYAAVLEQASYILTHKWWEVPEVGETEDKHEILRQQAILDRRGVKEADVILLINSGKSEGKAVEQGIAVALGKPIVAIGKLGAFSKNVFHYLDNYYWRDTFKDALKTLKELEAE